MPIEYEQKFFTKKLIYSLTNNIVERLEVSSIERSFDNIIYESKPLNANFDDLPFDGYEILIARLQIYDVNYDIVFRLNNGSSVYIYTNLIKKEFIFVNG